MLYITLGDECLGRARVTVNMEVQPTPLGAAMRPTILLHYYTMTLLHCYIIANCMYDELIVKSPYETPPGSAPAQPATYDHRRRYACD